jgi:hypothetical protein
MAIIKFYNHRFSFLIGKLDILQKTMLWYFLLLYKRLSHLSTSSSLINSLYWDIPLFN